MRLPVQNAIAESFFHDALNRLVIFNDQYNKGFFQGRLRERPVKNLARLAGQTLSLKC
jgi:hypothetical protein